MRPLAFLFALPLVACAPTEITVPTDEDHDGVMSDEEAVAGTDPQNADSDGDGHDDGVELDQGFDPNDADDHPYKGGYAVNRCSTEPEATGSGVGQIFAGFTLGDQHGEEVSLYDFCGSYVYIVAGTFW